MAPCEVNFVPAVAYHLCLALPAAFTQPGRSLFVLLPSLSSNSHPNPIQSTPHNIAAVVAGDLRPAVVAVAVAAAASEAFTLVRKGAEIDRVTNNQCQACRRFMFMKASFQCGCGLKRTSCNPSLSFQLFSCSTYLL